MKEFIEELIERLKKKKSEHLHDEEVVQGLGKINLASFCSAKARAIDGAIEIVNELAAEYNNDFCEWRLCDEEANVYDTTCRNLHILIEGSPTDNNHLFCPYCGKKIKVAPYQPKGE